MRSGDGRFGPAWNRPQGLPVLSEGEVHVWCADLEEAGSIAPTLERWLSEDERCRAGAFYFDVDRRRFMMARAVLRELLGTYLRISPAAVRFALDPYGKPRLAQPSGSGALHFNVAHSHQLALYAVARDRAVGVDVEQVRPEFSYDDIAEQFFSHEEKAALCTLPASRKAERFFTYWTCKEAYVKAIGMGLCVQLDSVHVEVGPEGGPAGLRIEGRPAEGSQWSIVQLAPCQGYTGAVAVRGANTGLTCWRWSSALVGEAGEGDCSTMRTSCRM